MATTPQSAAISTSNPDLAAQLSAILHGAAVAPITDRAFLRITGPDATRWLNGMVTNNIQALQPGEGNYNFLLNAQGRIQGDCTIYRTFFPGPPAYLLSTTADQAQAVHDQLDRFIIMDDVELLPFTERGLLVLGPRAPEVMQRLGLPAPGSLAFTQTDSAYCEVTVITPGAGLVPEFEIFPPSDEARCLPDLLQLAAAPEVSPEALEHLRILSGTPRYGVDIRNTATAHDLPQETAQDRALHFSKGCYLGQEIVERIRSRGSVHRTFTGFQLTGALPAPGAVLTAEGKPVGELTSVAAIPLPSGSVQLALGYIRREALERKLPLEFPGGTATPIALPFALP